MIIIKAIIIIYLYNNYCYHIIFVTVYLIESCPEGPKCANGGLMQNKGSCQCVCPWGLTEPVCQSLDTSPDREKKDNILLIKINIKT